MTDFVGSTDPDEFIGDGADDTFVNGGGVDTLVGNGGNDVFFLNALLAPGSVISGGEGIDSISILHPVFVRVNANVVFPFQVVQSIHTVLETQVASIERIEWENPEFTLASLIAGFGGTGAGATINQFTNDRISSTATLGGGPGYDQLTLLASYDGAITPSVTVDLPQFTYVDWQAIDHAWQPADTVVALILGSSDVTLNVTAHDGVVTAITGSGNDVVNGSDSMELFATSAGNDTYFGNGGNDTFLIENAIPIVNGVEQPALTSTGAGKIYDGGADQDFLAIGGAVTFQGTLVNVDAIYLVPEYFRPPDPLGANSARLPRSVLTIDDNRFAALPFNLGIVGAGDVILNLSGGNGFDGSSYTFIESGGTLTFTVNGDAAANDFIGSPLTDILNGGSGNDTFAISAGNDTIDGGMGFDVVTFSANFADASVSGGASSTIIVDGQTFANIELYRFADGDYVQNGTVLQPGIAGIVSDGYIAGARVFVDVNHDGGLSAGEPIATSGQDGSFVIVTNETGPLGAFGGTNIDTGLTNNLRFDAPEGARIISPLTSLIYNLVLDGASVATAEAQLESAFGFEPSIDLLQTDLIAAAANDPAALAGQKAAAQVAEILRALQDVGIAEFVTKNGLNDLITAGGSVDLASTATIDALIAAIAPNLPVADRTALVSEITDVNLAIAQAESIAEITQAQIGVLPSDEFSFFVADGFAGSVGGGGSIFGTAGFQDITVLDVRGALAFDPSFNRGGDIIRLSGNATQWQIVRSGSSAQLSDGDTVVTIPVGSAGLALVFDDGVRNLRFDNAENTFKIGNQAFAGNLTGISAGPDGTMLPTGADPDAAGVMFQAQDGSVSVGGRVDVFGTLGQEMVSLLSGNLTLDPSFNRGGDTIAFGESATDFTATRIGSSVLLESGHTRALLPVGSTGATLEFGNGTDMRTVKFDSNIMGFVIGVQLIGFDPVQLTASA